MRVLLDERVPRRLKLYFKEHVVSTVAEAGWSGIKNGRLLKPASGQLATVGDDGNG